jgi:hypothetical protein
MEMNERERHEDLATLTAGGTLAMVAIKNQVTPWQK